MVLKPPCVRCEPLVALLAGLFVTLLPGAVTVKEAPRLDPVVEAEEEVYSYVGANNGAGPMWCHGNTCLVRIGETVLASGIETIAGAKPLNNCLPLLFTRKESGWQQVFRGTRRTREPCPLVAFPDGRVFLSVNPTLTRPDVYGGPAKPELLEFAAGSPGATPVAHAPAWKGSPRFSEHSYRSFAADGPRGELILFQNIGYKHAEWAFRDRSGKWPAQGRIVWPWGAEYDKPQAIRLCYPAVALENRAVYFCGVSDIIEPYGRWRTYKKKLTGRDWDYDFRRLFFTWTDDITTEPFEKWVEVSSRDKTCGWIFPMDLHVAPSGDVFVLWSERALDERLRKEFFPRAKQRFSLELAVLRKGRVIKRTALVEGGEGLGGERPGDGRFQVTPDGRLFVFYHVSGSDDAGRSLSDHRVVEIRPDGSPGKPVTVKLKHPLNVFFTASVRAGCRPSPIVDLLGSVGGAMRYARIRLW